MKGEDFVVPQNVMAPCTSMRSLMCMMIAECPLATGMGMGFFIAMALCCCCGAMLNHAEQSKSKEEEESWRGYDHGHWINK